MAKRLYVGNLNYQTTSDGLADVFSECGEVTEVTVIDGKGFAFVEFEDDASARKAIEKAPSLLLNAAIKVVPLKKRNGRTLHRAGLKGLSINKATKACAIIIKRKGQCMEIQMRKGYRVAFNVR